MDVIIFMVIGILIGGASAFAINYYFDKKDSNGREIKKVIDRLDTIISDIKKTI